MVTRIWIFSLIGFIAIIGLTVVLLRGAISGDSKIYEREISAKCLLKVFKKQHQTSGLIEYEATFHRGTAIGSYAYKRFAINGERDLELEWFGDRESHIQCVFDGDQGVFFLFDDSKNEYWLAGDSAGNKGTAKRIWIERIVVLHTKNADVPVEPMVLLAR